jgi:hypothetical protein
LIRRPADKGIFFTFLAIFFPVEGWWSSSEAGYRAIVVVALGLERNRAWRETVVAK